jgi:hypothetical protein
MDTEQVKEFLKRIDMNYQTNWSEDKEIILEWYRDLKDYSIADVNKSFNNYMKSTYSNIPPKRWAILNNIKTIEEKDRLQHIHTFCQLCRKKVDMYEYDKHYGRCLDIDYLIRNGKKFLNKNWEKEQFYKLSDIDLQDKVLKMQKLVYENTTNKKEKAMLEEYLKKVGIV